MLDSGSENSVDVGIPVGRQAASVRRVQEAGGSLAPAGTSPEVLHTLACHMRQVVPGMVLVRQESRLEGRSDSDMARRGLQGLRREGNRLADIGRDVENWEALVADAGLVARYLDEAGTAVPIVHDRVSIRHQRRLKLTCAKVRNSEGRQRKISTWVLRSRW